MWKNKMLKINPPIFQRDILEDGRVNQKAPTSNQDSLARWAVDSHHTRINGQSGFQSVTQLLGFTHHPHRNSYYKEGVNKNNPEIASEIVFSPLWSVMLPIENRYYNNSKPKKYVKFRAN